ncbi:medium chain dehydrogenase/reductase family protein [Roseivirga sp. BDSF3-8]|uniref:synaptic vesicle VAT-1 family membrane protein n=1 Tax=Roseivirga sp. BDSF3-8 TaxID=3241598 RepID=UPI003531E8F8
MAIDDMRFAYRVTKAGTLKNLKLKEEKMPKPQPGEVLVKVAAIGLNFADIFAIKGLYSATPDGAFVPGLEYAGTIISTGEGVKHLKPGDKVMGVTRFGGYATHITIDARYVTHLPVNWSPEEGAAFPVQALTAYYALFELGNLQKGMSVLIHSAAGGVGIFAGRMAREAGAYTIGTIGSAKKVEVLEREGYEKIIVRDKDFPQKLNEALRGRELQVVLECIGGRIFKQSLEALDPMGRLVTYGSASFATHGNRPNYLKLIWKYLFRPKVDPMKLPTSNKSVMGFNLIWLYEKAELMHELMEKIGEMNIGKPFVGQTYDFTSLPEAVTALQSGQTVGKVIVIT